ncbi:hypothetical protein EMPS_01540 [Entomortierella parvispora]|uniref:Uncharacterized protein n=1 Tax=Entomortierella parvispora TaxID=205924 RepID=A0A9P3H322_9FUNG|nr:hypothetical protein EMPS_01540 [Entomortierella parvispora]
MEYLNPTTATFVAAGAGAGAYYVYANVIEPQNQAQRILQAEQAQQELLRLEEAKLSKRGSNKQAKKKVLVARPKKGDGSSDKDEPENSTKDVDERITISNPFDILDSNNSNVSAASAQTARKDPKKAANKKNSVSASTSAVAVTVVTTEVVGASLLSSPVSSPAKTDKVVKSDTTPLVQNETKVDTAAQNKLTSKREKKASKKAASTAAPANTAPVSVSTAAAAAVTTQTLRTGKISPKQVVSSPQEAVDDREPSSFSSMHTPAMQSRSQTVITQMTASHPPLHSEHDDFQLVKSQSRKHTAQLSVSSTESSAIVVSTPERSPRKSTLPKNGTNAVEPVQEEVKVIDALEKATGPSAQEWEALQALVKAKELALVALETRQNQFVRKIQELEKQMDADAEVVKSAKRTEARAQRFDEKVQSLNYTNTALVSQLSVEKENTKDALLKLKKVQREHEKSLLQAVTAASVSAAAAAMAEHVCASQEGVDHSSELSTMETRIQELEHHRDHLITQNSDLQLQLQQLISESDSLRQQEDTLREREEERTRFLTQVQFQLHEAQASLSKKEARIELLEAEMGALEGELEGSKLEAEQYAARVGQAEEAVRSLGESYEGEKHSLMEELEMVRAAAAQEAMHAVNKESSVNAELQEQLEHVRAELVKMKEEHQTLSVKHEEQVAAMSAAAAAAAAELSHQNGTGRVELAVKTLELQKVQDKLTSTQSELKTARAEAQTLADQLGEAQAAHTQQMSARQAELDHLAKELKESNGQIATMSEQQAETKAQVAELQARTSEFSDMAQAQSDRLLGRLEEMEKTLAATIEREESLGAEKEALGLQLTDLSTKHEHCEALHSKLTQEQTELSTKFSTTTLEHDQLLKEKEQLAAEVLERKEVIERLEKSKFSIASECETLSLKLRAAIEAEQAAQDKLAELEELKEEYAAMAAHILDLEAKLSVPQKQEELVMMKEAGVEQLSVVEVHTKDQVEEQDMMEEVEETMSVPAPAEASTNY